MWLADDCSCIGQLEVQQRNAQPCHCALNIIRYCLVPWQHKRAQASVLRTMYKQLSDAGVQVRTVRAGLHFKHFKERPATCATEVEQNVFDKSLTRRKPHLPTPFVECIDNFAMT